MERFNTEIIPIIIGTAQVCLYQTLNEGSPFYTKSQYGFVHIIGLLIKVENKKSHSIIEWL